MWLWGSSSVGTRGASSRLFCGRKDSSERMLCSASSSEFTAKSATPLLLAWVLAPPSSSAVTSSWVTVLITSGPVIIMWLVPFTMTMKSVMAGL